MKSLLFFVFFNFYLFGFSQKTIVDTSVVCFPTETAKEILKDLNELDKLKKTNILDKKEIGEFEKKVKDQDSIISKLEQKDKTNEVLVKSAEEKYKLLEEDNNDLRQEIKNVKIKNNIIEIVSAVIFSTITYIQLFK
jgi:septal ring factor EnvC (AmiA/AmiB activator)